MPKQKGTYRIKGKYDGRSYYFVKNGIGDVFRSINPNMSERVKHDPEFANTRKYAEEFGVAAGASQEFFKILKDAGYKVTDQTAVNKLNQMLTAIVRKDTEHPLGQRYLNTTEWQEMSRSFLNRLPRFDFDGNFLPNAQMSMEVDRSSSYPRMRYYFTASATTQNRDFFLQHGIKSIDISVYFCRLYSKIWIPERGGYYPTSSIVQLVTHDDIPQEDWDSLFSAESFSSGVIPLDPDKEYCTFGLVIANAMFDESPDAFRMKSLSSFKLIPVSYTNINPINK